MSEEILLIGGGLASHLTLQAIRQKNKTVPIRLITSDEGAFYHKPNLSSALSQKKTPADLVQSDVASLEEKFDITIESHTPVLKIDVEKKEVVTAKQRYAYGQCVLSCGALPRQIACEGDGASEILQVNHLSQYKRFCSVLKDKKKVTIIGAGLVGIEFAHDLSQSGYEVTVIHLGQWPLDPLAPKAVGALLMRKLSEVNWYCDTQLQRIDKTDTGYQMTLTSGEVFESECVLSAVGLEPNTELALASGIATHRGILTDAYLQTNQQDVYALGDCAEILGQVHYFIFPIRHASSALASTLLGEPTKVSYPAMPITLKTPLCPTVLCPPPVGSEGEWSIQGEGDDLEGYCLDAHGDPIGFVLCGRSMLAKRAEYTRKMPKWL